MFLMLSIWVIFYLGDNGLLGVLHGSSRGNVFLDKIIITKKGNFLGKKVPVCVSACLSVCLSVFNMCVQVHPGIRRGCSHRSV